MADGNTPAGDPAGQGAIPEKTAGPGTHAPVSDSTGLGDAGTSALDIERRARADAEASVRALKKQLAEIEKAQNAETQKVLTEQGRYKDLYANEQKAADALRAQLESANARWRDSQTSAALATALGSQVVDGSASHVMTALSPAITVDDEGNVSVDATKIAAIRSAKALDTTKVRDLNSLVTEFLAANPFFAASKSAGGAGGGGTGTTNGNTYDPNIMGAGFERLSPDEQERLLASPDFMRAAAKHYGKA